jgi:hypothetical protein
MLSINFQKYGFQVSYGVQLTVGVNQRAPPVFLKFFISLCTKRIDCST